MGRLSYSLLVVVITSIILLGWVLDQWYASQVDESADPVLEAYKELGLDLALWLDSREVDSNTELPRGSGFQSQILSYSDFPLPEDLRPGFEAGEPLFLDSDNSLSLHYYLPAHQQVLSLQLPELLHHESNSSLRWLLTLLFYTGIILVMLIWLFPLLRRLSLLRTQAQCFGNGQLHSRIPLDPHSYIHQIEEEFNRMAQRIEQLIADNKLLSRGLSHDLRTPLARLRFGMDVLEDTNLNQNQQKHLTHLSRDLLAMENLVDALLRYARLEQAEISFHPHPLSLAEFVKSLCQDFYTDQLTLVYSPEVIHEKISADPEYLGMLLHNLIQNAQVYGNGKLQVLIDRTAEGMRLSVEDNGPGIAPEERAKVLTPFYRGHSTNSPACQGHGLGLAIVERIALWHKAELTLAHSLALGGLRVSLVFPLVQ